MGLILKSLGWRLKLIFNSAGQRRKTAYTSFLIDAHGRGHRDERRLGLVRRTARRP